MGSETLSSACYILSDESSIPFYSALMLLIQTNISYKNKYRLFLVPRIFALNRIFKFFHRFIHLFIYMHLLLFFTSKINIFYSYFFSATCFVENLVFAIFLIYIRLHILKNNINKHIHFFKKYK